MIAIGHGRTPKTRSNAIPRAASIRPRNWSGPALSLFPIRGRGTLAVKPGWAGPGRKRQEGKHTNILSARLISTVDDKECRPGLSENKRDQVTKLGPVVLRWFTNKFICSGLRDMRIISD